MNPRLRIAAKTLTTGALLLLMAGCSSNNTLIGLWQESGGTSVEFVNSSNLVIYPTLLPEGDSARTIPGEYSLLDKSHLRISPRGDNPVIAEYSVAKNTLKLTTPEDGLMTFSRIHDRQAWEQWAKTRVALAQTNLASLPWAADLPKALEQARSERKLVLLEFTGSDWCVWCMKFEKDVLAQPDFAAYAKANLTMLLLDYPQGKKQPDEIKQRNAELKAKFKVEGFPTYVALNSEGREIGRQDGYLSGGPQAFITKLEQFKKQSR